MVATVTRIKTAAKTVSYFEKDGHYYTKDDISGISGGGRTVSNQLYGQHQTELAFIDELLSDRVGDTEHPASLRKDNL